MKLLVILLGILVIAFMVDGQNMGGIGKTTLLKGFIKYNKNNYNHIVWINFQNDLINSFTNNVVLLKNLNFSLMNNISPLENYKLLMNNIDN